MPLTINKTCPRFTSSYIHGLIDLIINKFIFMSFVLTFTPAGMTANKYDECIQKLEAAGAGNPKGRLYHVCYGDPNNVMVTDVWESVEDFENFGATLIPILAELGVDPGQPTPQPVRNVIEAPAFA
jgi:hypothetical protein